MVATTASSRIRRRRRRRARGAAVRAPSAPSLERGHCRHLAREEPTRRPIPRGTRAPLSGAAAPRRAASRRAGHPPPVPSVRSRAREARTRGVQRGRGGGAVDSRREQHGDDARVRGRHTTRQRRGGPPARRRGERRRELGERETRRDASSGVSRRRRREPAAERLRGGARECHLRRGRHRVSGVERGDDGVHRRVGRIGRRRRRRKPEARRAPPREGERADAGVGRGSGGFGGGVYERFGVRFRRPGRRQRAKRVPRRASRARRNRCEVRFARVGRRVLGERQRGGSNGRDQFVRETRRGGGGYVLRASPGGVEAFQDSLVRLEQTRVQRRVQRRRRGERLHAVAAHDAPGARLEPRGWCVEVPRAVREHARGVRARRAGKRSAARSARRRRRVRVIFPSRRRGGIGESLRARLLGGAVERQQAQRRAFSGGESEARRVRELAIPSAAASLAAVRIVTTAPGRPARVPDGLQRRGEDARDVTSSPPPPPRAAPTRISATSQPPRARAPTASRRGRWR